MSKYCIIDGEIHEYNTIDIDIQSATIRYGISIFEAPKICKVQNSFYLFRINEYLERFKNNCEKIGYFTSVSNDEIIESIRLLLNKDKSYDNFALRINLLQCGPTELLDVSNYKLIIYLLDTSVRFSKSKMDSVMVSNRIRHTKGEYTYDIKTPSNYFSTKLDLMFAKEKKCDDIVYLNQNKKVTELSRSNLFIIKDNSIFTPPLSDGLLAGITRKSIVDICKTLKLNVIEKSIEVGDLINADCVFHCGTSLGVKRINRLDGKELNNGFNELFEKISGRLNLIYSNDDPLSFIWMIKI